MLIAHHGEKLTSHHGEECELTTQSVLYSVLHLCVVKPVEMLTVPSNHLFVIGQRFQTAEVLNHRFVRKLRNVTHAGVKYTMKIKKLSANAELAWLRWSSRQFLYWNIKDVQYNAEYT